MGKVIRKIGNGRYEGIDEIMNNHLSILFKAILEVNDDYFNTKNPSKRKKGLYDHLERVFAYELYHQWSVLLAKYNKGVEKDDKRIVNGEIGKKMDKVTKFPDLVLHKGHNDLHNQEIVVEIKRRKWMRKDSVISDLEKISKFMEKGFLSDDASEYKEGVFILTGGNEDDISSQLETIQNKDSINKRIYCVFCKGDKTLNYVTLGELL